jgi:hypothetical protein
MPVQPSSLRRLCYLSAERIEGPFPRRRAVDVRSRDGRKMGTFDGVILDPTARRLRYLVVDSGSRFRHHRYLLPFPATQVDVAHDALRVDLDMDDLAHCSEFDRTSYPDLSDDDLQTTRFLSDRDEPVH